MAWSLALGYEASFGAVEASALTVGARLDGVVLALPALLAWEGLRGRPR